MLLKLSLNSCKLICSIKFFLKESVITIYYPGKMCLHSFIRVFPSHLRCAVAEVLTRGHTVPTTAIGKYWGISVWEDHNEDLDYTKDFLLKELCLHLFYSETYPFKNIKHIQLHF